MAYEIAMTHHEHFDGGGYPSGLRGDEIPICGRIVALADVYDALRSKRIYKQAFDHETARQTIVDLRRKQFDPDVIDAFLKREAEFVAIATQFDDQTPKSVPIAVPEPSFGGPFIVRSTTCVAG